MNRTPWVAVMAALAIIASACGSAAEPSTTTAPPETTTTDTVVADLGVAETFEVGRAVTHPNGTQLRFERIQYFATATVAEIGISNGSRFEIDLIKGDSQLISGTGETVDLLQPLSVTVLASGEDAVLSAVFGPLADRGSVSLLFNQGGGASPRGSTTSAPSFTVGPVALDPVASRPVLPPPAPLDRLVIAESGAELQLDGIVYTQTRIGLLVTIQNRSPVEVSISPTAIPSFLVDDLGNPYFLLMPEGEGFISVPPGEARRGVLSFAGRIDPAASSLTVGINDDRTDRRYAQYPRFVVDEIPIGGDSFAAVSPPDPFAPRDERRHPSGVTLRLDSVRFADRAIEVDVVVVNERNEPTGLSGQPSFAVDDLGSRLPLQTPQANPSFLVAENSEVEATLAFRGQLAAGATTVAFVFNEGSSPDDPDTLSPAFTFGPYPLVRADVDPVELEVSVFPVGARSVLASAELTVAETQIQAVASILRQFDATPVEGGFRLTLPDDILFDFGSASLRDDAIQSLSLIRDVLEYFEGDEVVVVGHTDSIGSESANQALSLSRAENVVDSLVSELGIPRDRLTAEGRGASEPVAPNSNPDGSDNPDGRQLNRRVEIFVLTDRPLPQG
jgi:outer membrane protein OmpA-like peptidoglycan-associated protein